MSDSYEKKSKENLIEEIKGMLEGASVDKVIYFHRLISNFFKIKSPKGKV